MYLLQAFGSLLLLSGAGTATAISELIPSSMSFWNLLGTQVNFASCTPGCVLTHCCVQIQADSSATQPPTTTASAITQEPAQSGDTTAATIATTATTTATTTVVTATSPPRCNKAAHFDAEKNHCVCNNPEMDGKIRDPTQYGDYPEGAVCYDCENSNESRAIAFILDETGTVGNKGWDAQKQFLLQILGVIGDIKVGIVVISSSSYVAVALDDYKNNANKISEFVHNKEFEGGSTAIGEALYLARTMLEQSDTNRKSIIIFSDGDGDWCDYWGCEHSQEQEANAIHRLGINVTYVAVNFDQGPFRIEKIAGDLKNVVKIADFTAFDSNVLNNVVNNVCEVEM